MMCLWMKCSLPLSSIKALMKNYPRNGEGLEAFVDASDTGYTMNEKPVETNGVSNGLKKLSVLNDDTHKSGVQVDVHHHTNGMTKNGVSTATKHVSGLEGVKDIDNDVNGTTENALTGVAFDGEINGAANGTNGHTNGFKI